MSKYDSIMLYYAIGKFSRMQKRNHGTTYAPTPGKPSYRGRTSRLNQWWIHFYLDILVPPVGSGDYSQLGFSILRSNNFVTKAVINVQFSKSTLYYNVVFEYFCPKPEISLQRLKNCCKVMQQEFYIGNF